MEFYWQIIIALFIGYILDLLLNDPRWMPHPIVGFGHSIHFFEKLLNKGSFLLMKGGVMAIFLIISVFLLFGGIEWFVKDNLYLNITFNALFVFFGIANQTLINEGKAVIKALENEGIDAGRKRLSWIVGRDTSQLNENQIRTAVHETMSENLSDGVVAPLFYFLIGGVPAMMTYKMVNTLDSMVGYKNDRYIQFGKVAARMDDVANFIPARITAFLMALTGWSSRSFRFIIKYGHLHASPNSGYPEAAMAGILNTKFGGPNIYHGRVVEKPFIGENSKELTNKDLKTNIQINHRVTFLTLLLIAAIQIFIHIPI